jgi:glycosyltransferase involved in cell wall biosynthesis
VLIIVENLPVPLDRRVWMEATTLQQAGYDVTVISPIGSGFDARREIRDDVLILRHPLPIEGRGLPSFVREYTAALWWEYRLAAAAWRERPYRVVHICNPPDLLFLVAAWLRLRRGARVLFDQHDLFPEMYRAKYGREDIVYRLIRVAERLTMATAHRVLCTNQTGVDVATSRGGKAREVVHVVGSGPDTDLFTVMPTEDRYRAGRRYLVGYVGILGDQDGGDLLLEAVAHTVQDLGREDVGFMIIGDGPALEDLRGLAVQRGLAGHVEFTGTLFGDELRARLSTADVCIDPEPVNGYSEYCTTNKVLEYMALGRPVVMFDRLEGRRAAGPASVYATPNDPRALADALVELLDDPERRDRLGAAGRHRVESVLSWNHQRNALLDAYEALLRDDPAGLAVRVDGSQAR